MVKFLYVSYFVINTTFNDKETIITFDWNSVSLFIMLNGILKNVLTRHIFINNKNFKYKKLFKEEKSKERKLLANLHYKNSK